MSTHSAHVRFVDPPTPTSPNTPFNTSSPTNKSSTASSEDTTNHLEAVRTIFDRLSQAAAETKAAGEAFEQLGHTLQHLATHLKDQSSSSGSAVPTAGSASNGGNMGVKIGDEARGVDERWYGFSDTCGEQVCWTRSWTGSCACKLPS